MDLESVAKNAQGIRALARSLLRDDAEADDVVQEAYLAALRRPPAAGVSPHAWLAGVVRNLALKRRRTEARIRRRERAAARAEASPPPTEVVERAETHRALMRELLELPQPYRTTLLLRYFDGLSLKEIAQRLDLPMGTVGTHVHRGLARLRLRLDTGHGGRRKWSVALLPLVGLPVSIPTTTIGVAAMSANKTTIIGIAALLALLVTLGFWVSRGDEKPLKRAEREESTTESGSDRSQPEAALPPAVDFASVDRDLDLFGIVVDGSGAPVPGAVIETFWLPWRRASLSYEDRGENPKRGPGAIAAADGSFSLRLRRGQRVNLRARTPALGMAELAQCQAGERVRVVLGASARLVVEVVDEDGQPVKNAAVRLFKPDQAYPVDQFVERSGKTAADGLCRFADLPSGGWAYAVASHDLYGSGLWKRVYLGAPAQPKARLVLLRGRIVSGRVVDAATGAGIAGAEVGSGWMIHRPVKTREDGTFDYAGWTAEGVMYMAARASGYARGRVIVGTKRTVELALDRAGSVAGRITDSAGEPVRGALLSLRARDAAATFVTYGRGETDADGNFRIENVGTGAAHTLTIVAPEHGRRLVDFDMPDTPEMFDLGVIRLGAPLSIEGRVVLPDGIPAAGVLVKLEGANADRGARRPDGPIPYLTGGMTEQRRTDDLGRFRFPELAPGAYTVSAEPSGYKPTSVDVDLKRGEAADSLSIAIPGGHALSVRLVDPEGKPIQGVSVQVHLVDQWFLQRMTDSSGGARFEADSEPVKVTLFDFENRYLMPVERRVDVGATEVRFVLEPSAEIRGIVRDPDGKPLPQVPIRIMQEGQPVLQQGGGGAWSDMEGHFRIRLPMRGAVDLYLTGAINTIDGVNDDVRPGFTGALYGVTPGSTGLVLQAKAPEYERSLRVRVRAPDGSPLAGAQVYVKRMGKLVPGANKLTDSNGWALLSNLPDADVEVYARLVPGMPSAQDWLRERAWPVRPNGQELELRLRRARHARGVVRVGKEAVAGAFVILYKETRILTSVQSSADGRFDLQLDFAEPGPLWVHATWRDEAGVIYQARIDDFDPSKSEPLELTLTPPK